MITKEFLTREVIRSRHARRTTMPLRLLGFFVLKNALTEHYGSDYSDRCLQSSIGVQMFLSHVGLEATLWSGAARFAEAYNNPPHDFRFSGFWGKDHHFWVETEFTEVVDFTVTQVHQHPASTRCDCLAIPPIWWDDVSQWPATIRYLPDSALVGLDLPSQEAADLEQFREVLRQVLGGVLEQLDPADVPGVDILDGPNAIGRLYQAGHPWVVDTARYQAECVPEMGKGTSAIPLSEFD